MPTQTPRSFSFRLAFVGLALLSACDGERSPSALTPGDSRLAAKSGSGGSTSLTVASSSPTQATQDTALSVTVTGTGFTTGARAVWALDGDTTLVHVKSTKVMGSTQLVAQLVIPLGAPVASYDIQVLLVDGQ